MHEFLLKPVSSATLVARIVSVLSKPRTMVQRGDYYGPEPRKLATYKPEADSYNLLEQAANGSPTHRIFV